MVCRIPLDPIAELRRRPYPATPCLHSRGTSRACKTPAYAPSPKREADPESGRRGSKPSRRGPEGRPPAAVAYARLGARQQGAVKRKRIISIHLELNCDRTRPFRQTRTNQSGTGLKTSETYCGRSWCSTFFSHFREGSLGITLQRHRIPSYVLLHFRLIRRNSVGILGVFQSVRLPAHTIPG
jgi:hypothetical protein